MIAKQKPEPFCDLVLGRGAFHQLFDQGSRGIVRIADAARGAFAERDIVVYVEAERDAVSDGFNGFAFAALGRPSR